MTHPRVEIRERGVEVHQRDRESLQELESMLRTARDRAHWLAVHRRMRMARHIEEQLDTLLRMAYDLRGRHQRGEPL